MEHEHWVAALGRDSWVALLIFFNSDKSISVPSAYIEAVI